MDMQICRDIVSNMIKIFENKSLVARKLWVNIGVINTLENWKQIQRRHLESIIFNYKEIQKQIESLPKIIF